MALLLYRWCFVAAVVTPPDVVSQLALAIPMCLLYEVGILAARLVSKPVPKENAAVNPEKSAKTDTKMGAQMDAAEADFRNISGK